MTMQFAFSNLHSAMPHSRRNTTTSSRELTLHSQDIPERKWIDGALYPDVEPPERLHGLAEQVDFLARLCSAWDFGLLPNPETVAEIRRAEWSQAVDACRLLTSPVYHLLRSWHGLVPLPYLGQQMAYIRDDPSLEHV